MTSELRAGVPAIPPSQVRDGDIVIRRAALEEHPELDADEVLAKLGELGLPSSVVARHKTGDVVELAAYDAETQPPLGKHPWSDFEAFLEAGNLNTSVQGRLRSELAHIHNHGIRRDGGSVAPTDTRAPLLYSRESGDPFGYKSSMDVTKHQDTSGILIDVGVLEQYLRHDDLERFSNIGPALTAAYTEFVNAKIAELPGA